MIWFWKSYPPLAAGKSSRSFGTLEPEIGWFSGRGENTVMCSFLITVRLNLLSPREDGGAFSNKAKKRPRLLTVSPTYPAEIFTCVFYHQSEIPEQQI